MRSFENVRPTIADALRQSDWIDAVVLAPGVPQVYVVPEPGTTRFVHFSASGDFWAKVNGAAVVPAGNVTNGTAPELNPSTRFVGYAAATTIGLVSELGCVVSIACYRD